MSIRNVLAISFVVRTAASIFLIYLQTSYHMPPAKRNHGKWDVVELQKRAGFCARILISCEPRLSL